MQDTDFLRLKIVTEKELGRDLGADEEHTLKMLYYFGKGVKLKAQLDGGPERIGPIAVRALSEIDRRRKIVLQRGVLQRHKRRRKHKLPGSALRQERQIDGKSRVVLTKDRSKGYVRSEQKP